MMAQLQEKSAEEQELKKEIREMTEKNSVVRAGLEVHSRIKASRVDNSRPPSSTPQPGPIPRCPPTPLMARPGNELSKLSRRVARSQFGGPNRAEHRAARNATH